MKHFKKELLTAADMLILEMRTDLSIASSILEELKGEHIFMRHIPPMEKQGELFSYLPGTNSELERICLESLVDTF